MWPGRFVFESPRKQAIASEYRRDGKTIVFTNGCFDLLHAGHLTMLEEASRCGDVLIVAINSDVDNVVLERGIRCRLLRWSG